MVSAPATSTATKDWRLRSVLLSAFAVLVVTSAIVAATSRPSAERSLARPKPKITTPVETTVPSAVPRVPGATTGAVTLPRIGGPCGFALAAARTRRVGHCTVLEIGDSLGNDLGWGLSRQVSAHSGLVLVQADKSSTGLVNTAYYDWPSELAAELSRYHPQLVLVCLGGNDQQGMQLSNAAVQFPTSAWRRAYLARVRQFVRQASRSGAYVVWVGLPVMGPPTYSRGTQILDSLYRRGVTSVANGTYLSTWSLFSNPEGQFQSNAVVNNSPTTLRAADGIHFSFAGEDVFATYVLRELAAIYHVRLRPTDPTTVTSWS